MHTDAHDEEARPPHELQVAMGLHQAGEACADGDPKAQDER
jgi:hypothetical protein